MKLWLNQSHDSLTDGILSGFLTSPELSYVRNHGAVPQVSDEEIPDWAISIEGLVENPITITFKEVLEKFEQVTLPITLVCAGNRRKEQNVVRKSQGFSWGAAGVSTSLFTGPMLADVIKKAKPTRKARFLCMEGADQLVSKVTTRDGIRRTKPNDLSSPMVPMGPRSSSAG